MGLFSRKPKPPPGPIFDRQLTRGEDVARLYLYHDKQRANVAALVDKHASERGWVILTATFQPEPSNRYDPDAVFAVAEGRNIGYFYNGAQNIASTIIQKAGRRHTPTLEVGLYCGNSPGASYFAHPSHRDTWAKEQHSRLARSRIWGLLRAAPHSNIRQAGKHQPQLKFIHEARPGHDAPCTITVDAQPTGKYKGGPRLSFHVPNLGVIGVSNAQFQQQDSDFYTAVINGQQQGTVITWLNDAGEYWSRCYLVSFNRPLNELADLPDTN